MQKHYVSLALAAAVAAVSCTVSAASMNKCVDAQGHVTFTQQACPGGGAGERLDVKAQSEGMLIAQPPAAPADEVVAPAATSPAPQVNVVGGENSSGCGTASDQEIRTAIIGHKVFPGMSAKEAMQSWGEPSSINRSSNGDDQWVYNYGHARLQFIYVNQAGCVTAWN